jgi:hypothetical protein
VAEDDISVSSGTLVARIQDGASEEDDAEDGGHYDAGQLAPAQDRCR